jgi:anti-sigma factor RsiW
MKTTCERYSESLLMLVHNELRGWTRVQTEAHLLLCPECRTKERRLRSLSTTLAISLRNPSLGSRTFPRAKPAVWTTLGLGAVAAVFLGSQLIGAQLSSITPSSNYAGPHCDVSQAPSTGKLVPPPMPKPPVAKPANTLANEEKKHACLNELR